jgi:hypothetical protein
MKKHNWKELNENNLPTLPMGYCWNINCSYALCTKCSILKAYNIPLIKDPAKGSSYAAYFTISTNYIGECKYLSCSEELMKQILI